MLGVQQERPHFGSLACVLSCGIRLRLCALGMRQSWRPPPHQSHPPFPSVQRQPPACPCARQPPHQVGRFGDIVQFHQLRTEHVQLCRGGEIESPPSLGPGRLGLWSTPVPMPPPPCCDPVPVHPQDSPPGDPLQSPTSALTLHIPVSTLRARAPGVRKDRNGPGPSPRLP